MYGTEPKAELPIADLRAEKRSFGFTLLVESTWYANSHNAAGAVNHFHAKKVGNQIGAKVRKERPSRCLHVDRPCFQTA